MSCTRVARRVVCLAVLVAFGILPASARGQKPAAESDAYFKSAKIVHLELEIRTRESARAASAIAGNLINVGPFEMDELRRDPRKYVRCLLKEDGKVVATEVGVHIKGAAGSYRGIDDKACLTLNMDKFKKDQTFHGMDKFHLANSVQDPSYLSELMCGELFRAAGVPASRIHHVLLTINGRKRGLYYLKEGYDSFFLKRHFGNSEGNFYDGGFLREIDQPLQLVSTRNDVKNQADLKALLTAAREKPAERFAKLEKPLDMDKFLAYTVLEVIAWDWDGYPLNRNNYRIYHNPKTDKITFIPSGMDQMFGDTGGSILPGFQGFIARAVLETPEGKDRYFKKMADIMKNVYKTDEMIKRLDELEARVQPVLASVDAGAARDYKHHVNRLRQAFKARQKSVEDQLARLMKK
jgi:spore coat protein H